MKLLVILLQFSYILLQLFGLVKGNPILVKREETDAPIESLLQPLKLPPPILPITVSIGIESGKKVVFVKRNTYVELLLDSDPSPDYTWVLTNEKDIEFSNQIELIGTDSVNSCDSSSTVLPIEDNQQNSNSPAQDCSKTEKYLFRINDVTDDLQHINLTYKNKSQPLKLLAVFTVYLKPEPVKNNDIILNVKGNKKEYLTVQTGSMVYINLESNPSTGYSWLLDNEFDIKHSLSVEYLENTFKSDCGPEVDGCGGTETFSFYIVDGTQGLPSIDLIYKRPWETENNSPIEKVEIILRSDELVPESFEVPTVTSVETLFETPSVTSIETFIETSTETTIETVFETSTETTIEAVLETPTEMSIETPIQPVIVSIGQENGKRVIFIKNNTYVELQLDVDPSPEYFWEIENERVIEYSDEIEYISKNVEESCTSPSDCSRMEKHLFLIKEVTDEIPSINLIYRRSPSVAILAFYKFIFKSEPDKDKDIIYNVGDNEEHYLEAQSESMLYIKLKSNPSTGYSWFLEDEIAIERSNTLEYLDTTFESDCGPEIDGCGGTETLSFYIIENINALPNILLTYRRPWETKNDAVKKVRIILYSNEIVPVSFETPIEPINETSIDAPAETSIETPVEPQPSNLPPPIQPPLPVIVSNGIEGGKKVVFVESNTYLEIRLERDLSPEYSWQLDNTFEIESSNQIQFINKDIINSCNSRLITYDETPLQKEDTNLSSLQRIDNVPPVCRITEVYRFFINEITNYYYGSKIDFSYRFKPESSKYLHFFTVFVRPEPDKRNDIIFDVGTNTKARITAHAGSMFYVNFEINPDSRYLWELQNISELKGYMTVEYVGSTYKKECEPENNNCIGIVTFSFYIIDSRNDLSSLYFLHKRPSEIGKPDDIIGDLLIYLESDKTVAMPANLPAIVEKPIEIISEPPPIKVKKPIEMTKQLTTLKSTKNLESFTLNVESDTLLNIEITDMTGQGFNWVLNNMTNLKKYYNNLVEYKTTNTEKICPEEEKNCKIIKTFQFYIKDANKRLPKLEFIYSPTETRPAQQEYVLYLKGNSFDESQCLVDKYSCCSNANAEVVQTDSLGDWSIENSKWCFILPSSSSCFSVKLGYPCCSQGVKTEYEDHDGAWGVENGEWCGIQLYN